MVKNGTFNETDDPFDGDGGFVMPMSPPAEKEPEAFTGQPGESSGGLTVEDVKRAVVGSVGDVTTIAAKLGVDRVAMRRYINAHPEVKEAIEDEILSARENVIKQTYDDAINGSQAARQDFFKMTGGMFDKKEEKAGETQQLIIQFTSKQKTFKALDPATGEMNFVNAEDLQPTVEAEFSDTGDEEDDDDDDDSEEL